MEKDRAAEFIRAAKARQKNRKTPAEDQIKKLFSKPCIIRWSDGHESPAIIGDVFYTEEAYSRYRAYKESGKPHPVAVEIDPLQDPATIVFPEDPEGERRLCETISEGFTKALKQFVEQAGEPVDLPPLVDDEAAEEINRQAEEAQRELQRIADEADEAIRGTL